MGGQGNEPMSLLYDETKRSPIAGTTVLMENEKIVVRYKFSEGEIIIYIHRKDDVGKEIIPRGYVMGSNYLTFKM